MRRAALGLLAAPLVMQSCQPACAPAEPAAPRVIEQRTIGTSWQGRPIVAYRLGTPGGKVVLAVGSIHGDEQTGIEIVDNIRDSAAIPPGLDVWVIPTINPDGNAMNVHTNAAGVDLNRNFSPDWQATDCAVSPRFCAGPAPMSEPESQAIAAFVNEIQPKMTVWYHGPLFTVDAALLHGVANPAVLYAYAGPVGYSVTTVRCSPTGYCTGNATQYMNTNIPGSSAFVVELSSSVAGSFTDAGVAKHVAGFFAAAAAA
jgi:protein MpaA